MTHCKIWQTQGTALVSYPHLSVSYSSVSLKELPLKAEKAPWEGKVQNLPMRYFAWTSETSVFFTRLREWVVIINTQFCSLFDILSALIFFTRHVSRKHSLKKVPRFYIYYKTYILYCFSFFYYFLNTFAELSTNSCPCCLCTTSMCAVNSSLAAFKKC